MDHFLNCKTDPFDNQHIRTEPLIYIITLNWNGWRDTLECLESIFKNNYTNYRVIICDNESDDSSIAYIKKWAEAKLDVSVTKDNRLRNKSFPPCEKPIPYVEYNRHEAEQGGRLDQKVAQLIIINTGANLGFAGGNNIGLRYALARDDFDYVWLLNNDTVIDSEALTALVRRMQVDPLAGMCGSKLLYYDSPDVVQALGGATFNSWLATSRPIGAMSHRDKASDRLSVEKKLDYIIGASMLISKAFLKRIGLMCEDYFLFFEEIDWALRSKSQFNLVYAEDSVIYHKEGSSISSSCPKKKSYKADYYSVHNRLLFTRKHYKYRQPIVYLSLFGVMLNRVKRKQWSRVRLVLRELVQYAT